LTKTQRSKETHKTEKSKGSQCKSPASNDIFLSLQSVSVILHSALFQFYEFHVVCINLGSFFIQWNKKFKSKFHNNQLRIGMFLRGEFGPRRRPWPLITGTSYFKYKPSPTMPSPEPVYVFKYSP